MVYRYDTKCVPGNMLHNKVAYIQNASIDKTCTIILKVKERSPIRSNPFCGSVK
jgi:hypothetical protein